MDFGCGDGVLLALLDTENKIGLDIALPYLKSARAKGLTVYQHDIEIPFDIQKVDIIILNDVLEHVLNPEKVFQNAKNLLKKNGKLYIVIPWKEDLTFYDIYKGTYKYTHLRSYNNLDITDEFRIIRFKGIIPKKPNAGVRRIIYSFLNRFFPSYRDTILFRVLRFEPSQFMIEAVPTERE